MHSITALKDTFLKKTTEQSSNLPDNKKVFVPKDKIYQVKKFKLHDDNMHYFVTLDHDAGDWYIYDPIDDGHWVTSWEDREEETHSIDPQPDNLDSHLIAVPGKVDWSKGSFRISRYFTVREVTLNDSRRIPKSNSPEEKNILTLAIELDKIRADWKSGITVTSWFRPSTINGYPHEVNRSVGGARYSQHIYGCAADIRPINGKLDYFQRFVDAGWYGALGYGAKRGFCHVDSRNKKGWKSGGTKGVRWNY